MGVEVVQNFQKNQDKYKDFRNALSDSYLDEKEQEELTTKYYTECSKIHEETQGSCNELQREIKLYKEITQMSQGNNSEIQKLQILSGVQNTDGLRGPITFASYFKVGDRGLGLEGLSPKQVVQKYDEVFSQIQEKFDSFSDKSLRQDIQRKVGTGSDGSFGPNTFKAIMKNPQDNEDIKTIFYNITSSVEVSTEIQKDTKQEVKVELKEDVIPASDILGNHHPEVFVSKEDVEALSDAEKIEIFKKEAKSIPRVLIKFLQAGVGTGVDGAFGPNSARAVIAKYPEAQTLKDVMQLEGIPMKSDGVLPIRGNTPESKREVFREMYGDYVDLLGNNLNLPTGFIEAIIRQETKHGTYGGLMSPSGCKGMMQLSKKATQDMLTAHRGNIRNYRESFQNLNLDALMGLNVGDKGVTIRESIPAPIVQTLYILNNPDTSNRDYNLAIQQLENFIKGDNSYFNHAVNMILGSVYLSGIYHDHTKGHGGMGNITATADLYNAAPGERVGYRRKVTQYFNEYNKE